MKRVSDVKMRKKKSTKGSSLFTEIIPPATRLGAHLLQCYILSNSSVENTNQPNIYGQGFTGGEYI